MPTVPSNALATSSDSTGRNVRAEWAAESFFLLEKNETFSQTPDDKFGIKGTGANSTFRTTSKITNYTGKVFTICQGQIFVQPNAADSTKVNVILKPFSQPMKGLAIKYIIYRGLLKSDFFDNGQVLQSSGSSTEFITRIREDFAKFYGSNGVNTTPPPFLAEYIGYPASNPQSGQEQNDTDLIDDYFFKKSVEEDVNGQITQPEKRAYELPIIPQGIYLGNTNGALGIDIVLNEGDFSIENDPNPFQLNLQYARAADFELNANTGNAFQDKLIRESATQFMDIAAFYGMHAQGKGKLKVNTQTAALQTVNEIYGAIQSFQTAKTSYLYIQSNRQRSYNFYGNYDLNGNNIKIGFDENNLVEKKFGTENWPIEKISNVGTQDKLFLQFLHGRDFNIPILYSFNKNVKNTESIYFANSEELIDANLTNPIEYTNKIEIPLEKVSNHLISEAIFIGYQGVNFEIDNYQDFPLSQKSNYFLLHKIFPLVNVNPSLIYDEGSICVLENYKISPLALLSYKEVFLASTKVVTDFGKKMISSDNYETKKRKTFISHILRIPDNLNMKSSRFFNPTNLLPTSSQNKILEFIYSEKGFSLKSFLLQENGVDFKSLSIKYNDEIINEYFHLGITDEELDSLKQLIPAEAYNVRFKFNDETSYDIDFENDVVFYKFSLGIAYENSMGNLEESFPQTEVNVYGIKINFLVSKDYADYEDKATEEQVIL